MAVSSTPFLSDVMNHTYDAIVIGGGTAGLTAALYLGRSRRRTLVLAGGAPRNAPAHAAYGVFTRDGTPPLDLLRLARADAEAYPTVEIRDTEARSARTVVLATGVVDELPDVPGVRHAWGGGLFHCPYCHGYEVRDRPLGVWVNNDHTLHMVTLLRGWSDDITILTDGPAVFPAADRRTLDALGIPVIEARIRALDVEGSDVRGVVFQDGARLDLGGILIGVPQRERSGIPASLGVETNETGHIATDVFGMTSVPGSLPRATSRHPCSRSRWRRGRARPRRPASTVRWQRGCAPRGREGPTPVLSELDARLGAASKRAPTLPAARLARKPVERVGERA